MSDLNTIAPKTAMARLVRAITALQDRELSQLGLDLTAQQAAIVAYVDAEGAKSMGEIAARIGVDPSVATRLVDRLETKGHAARSPHSEDRRAVQVSTTPEGSRVVAVAVPAINALKSRIFAGIADAEIEVFWRVLGAIESNVAAAAEEDPNRIDQPTDR
jgi:DNA-binding MarR family transcriptional regulator